MTKDEKFVLKLYKLAKEQGDPTTEIDRYLVGNSLGLHTKAVDSLVQNLMRSNFVRRRDENAIYLTEGGLALVQELSGRMMGK